MANGMWGVKFDTATFEANVRRIMPALKADVQKVVDKQANDFANAVKRNASRSQDAPHIADTVRIEPGDTTKIEKVVKIGDAATHYGAPLEYGHVAPDGSFVKGARFWTPAKKVYNKKFRAAVKRAVRKAFKAFTP